jgi:outer membrane protein assembly factor BamE (lipoprotein component of BamABCDE complex)
MRHLPFLLALLLVGCVTVGTKISPDQVSALRAGESYDDVVASLGHPDSLQTDSGGTRVISYSYGHATPFGSAHTDVLMLRFDKSGTLQKFQQISN